MQIRVFILSVLLLILTAPLTSSNYLPIDRTKNYTGVWMPSCTHTDTLPTSPHGTDTIECTFPEELVSFIMTDKLCDNCWMKVCMQYVNPYTFKSELMDPRNTTVTLNTTSSSLALISPSDSACLSTAFIHKYGRPALAKFHITRPFDAPPTMYQMSVLFYPDYYTTPQKSRTYFSPINIPLPTISRVVAVDSTYNSTTKLLRASYLSTCRRGDCSKAMGVHFFQNLALIAAYNYISWFVTAYCTIDVYYTTTPTKQFSTLSTDPDSRLNTTTINHPFAVHFNMTEIIGYNADNATDYVSALRVDCYGRERGVFHTEVLVMDGSADYLIPTGDEYALLPGENTTTTGVLLRKIYWASLPVLSILYPVYPAFIPPEFTPLIIALSPRAIADRVAMPTRTLSPADFDAAAAPFDQYLTVKTFTVRYTGVSNAPNDIITIGTNYIEGGWQNHINSINCIVDPSSRELSYTVPCQSRMTVLADLNATRHFCECVWPQTASFYPKQTFDLLITITVDPTNPVTTTVPVFRNHHSPRLVEAIHWDSYPVSDSFSFFLFDQPRAFKISNILAEELCDVDILIRNPGVYYGQLYLGNDLLDNPRGDPSVLDQLDDFNAITDIIVFPGEFPPTTNSDDLSTVYVTDYRVFVHQQLKLLFYYLPSIPDNFDTTFSLTVHYGDPLIPHTLNISTIYPYWPQNDTASDTPNGIYLAEFTLAQVSTGFDQIYPLEKLLIIINSLDTPNSLVMEGFKTYQSCYDDVLSRCAIGETCQISGKCDVT